MTRLALFIAASVILSACVSTRHDPAPKRAPHSTTGATPSSTSAKTNPYEVFGQRYYPITDATDYRERGVASWYGGKFHGRLTANGERYDMHQYTAAHTTLPLPTLVKVTNLRNGSSVVVRVNDRGPFVKNRLIDLSYAAAMDLDMIGDGTTLVEVEAIMTADAVPSAPITPIPVIAQTKAQPVRSMPTRTPPPTVTQPVTRAGTVSVSDDAAGAGLGTVSSSPDQMAGAATIFVQVGAFGEYPNALRMQSSLYNAGIANARLNSGDRQGIPVHRVQIGPIASVPEYDVLITQLEAIGISDTHLVTE